MNGGLHKCSGRVETYKTIPFTHCYRNGPHGSAIAPMSGNDLLINFEAAVGGDLAKAVDLLYLQSTYVSPI